MEMVLSNGGMALFHVVTTAEIVFTYAAALYVPSPRQGPIMMSRTAHSIAFVFLLVLLAMSFEKATTSKAAVVKMSCAVVSAASARFASL
jgi:hypothetical protein